MFYKANCTFSGLHELQASCPNPVTDERGQTLSISIMLSDFLRDKRTPVLQQLINCPWSAKWQRAAEDNTGRDKDTA